MPELESKTYQSPRASYEYLDCSLPLTFDQYSVCSYNCLYCFAFYQRAMNASSAEDFWDRKIHAVDPDYIKAIINQDEALNKNRGTARLIAMVKQKLPLHWGGLSDPADEYEKQFGVGLEIIKHLRKAEYPTLFSIKGDAFLKPEYLKEFEGSKNFKFQMSITSADDEIAKKIELGVPTPTKRIEMIKTFTGLGCECMLRLRPYIIGYSDKTVEELIVRSREAGATAVSVEFFCLERRAAGYLRRRYEEMNQALGFNVYDYYKHLSRGSGYLRLNSDTKVSHVKKIYQLCRKLGMRFACSDAHFKELNDTGCCCGLDSSWAWSRGQFTNALIKARKCGSVCWKDIDVDREWEPFWKFSEVRNCGDWKRYRKYKNVNCGMAKKNIWNNPKDSGSPYLYFDGRLKPTKLDEEGNVMYDYVPHSREGEITGEGSVSKQGQS